MNYELIHCKCRKASASVTVIKVFSMAQVFVNMEDTVLKSKKVTC